MAVLAVAALSAGGTFTGLAGVGFISGIAASYIDQQFLYPALRGSSELPDRLQDLIIQTVSEGSPVARFYGPKIKLAGQLIWSTDLVTVGGSGGKGLGADRAKATDVLGTFAVAFGEGRLFSKLKAMWADEKLIWNEESPENFDISSTDFEVIQNDHYFLNPGVSISDADFPEDFTWQHGELRLRSLTSTFDKNFESHFAVGQRIRLRDIQANIFQFGPGFVAWQDLAFDPTGQSSIPIKITKLGTDTNGKTFLEIDLRNEFSVAGYETFLPTVAGGGLTSTSLIDADFQPFDEGRIESVTVYSGTDTQSVDPTILGVETKDVEAFRGIAYVVIKNLLLNDFGNRIPNITAIWENNGDILVGEAYTYKNAIADILSKNLGGEEFSLVGLDVQVGSSTVGVPVGNVFDSAPLMGGFFVRGPQETLKVIQPLALARQIIAQETEGVLKFKLRKNADVVTVNANDLAAHLHGDDTPSAFNIKDDPESTLPSNVEVKFVDEDKDLQQGHERERTATNIFDDIRVIDLPITMTSDDARNLALSHLWTLHSNRRKVGPITLPPSYLHIAEGDILRIPALGDTWDVLITRVDRGENFILEVEGMIEEADTLQFAGM